MNFKIGTKEKFCEIIFLEPNLSANMTDEIEQLLNPYLENEPKNIVLSLEAVQTIDISVAEKIALVQQTFYEHSASFVVCGLNPALEKQLENYDLLEQMNVTPTLSEAWDMVQMEEIERELLDGF
jgi:anti-anti-sigma regulatory factor